MRPFHIWLLAIVFFVVPMVVAFYLGGLARRAGSSGRAQLDPDLAVAIETSRRTLPTFIEKLQKPPQDARAFVVKATFLQNGHAEMMWVDHLSFTNGAFKGTLADVPSVVTRLHKGDPVDVPQADVVDWEIFYHSEQGDLHEGGETDRVLQRHQSGHTLRYPPRMPSSPSRFA